MKEISELIEKYNAPVPRYTSYPPANFFNDAVGETEYVKMIEQSDADKSNLIAFYIHVPFCKKICFYCGCNACTIRNDDAVDDYFTTLHKEIDNIIARLDKNRKISQIHFGGGTPNAVDVSYLTAITGKLLRQFQTIEKPEIAIECNPAYLDNSYIQKLVAAGFNRFSLGIQDFDTEVLKTVNRQPSAVPVEDLVTYIKSLSPGISVNLDFIYGLPGQTVESFTETIRKAAAIRPDRLVTFSYAHVPWMKKHQQILEKKGLPGPGEKMDMFLGSRDILLEAGYKAIGLDHYVLPEDELNTALENNMLHRNFQGYCTKRTTGQVYAFGVSAISQLENGYTQNVKEIKQYKELIENGKLPVEKGYELTDNEAIVRDVITQVMCNDAFDMNAFSAQHGISPDQFLEITGFKEERLSEMISDGLIQYGDHRLQVNESGKLFIRNLAVLFDPAYKSKPMQYSKTV
ncbi:oxygen-independent coproporphyrinogen III oxidase [Saccharicrinis sp. FJH54]|uniref:oxygen-independent coproporphyrinogen III oxidase n=1 Tax=Saccharicrinis sp. FJH54 TaxID=3344665 RepID=UPI0035D47130